MSGWIVGGLSTGADVLCEKGTSSGGTLSQRELVLRGYSIHQGSSLAGSTVAFTLRAGESSAVGLSSTPLALGAPEFFASVEGLDVRANYFAIVSPSTHVNAVVATMWGDYG